LATISVGVNVYLKEGGQILNQGKIQEKRVGYCSSSGVCLRVRRKFEYKKENNGQVNVSPSLKNVEGRNQNFLFQNLNSASQ
jgi:hypothetical protein